MGSQIKLHTVGEVIQLIGGPTAVARRFRVPPNTVSMWKLRRRFPKDTFDGWQKLLREKNATAPMELWHQKEVQ